MKYGESTFDIAYLLFALIMGGILVVRNEKQCKYMGAATLLLGGGDAFHLIPRVLNYFTDGNYTAALGIGKLFTSITMTIFYILMYRIWLTVYEEDESRNMTVSMYLLAAVRIVLCLMPQNNWIGNDSPLIWGIIRNIPFIIIGMIIVSLYYRKRRDNKALARVWLYVLLSFLFYIPVATVVSFIPMLGMLMLPKTVCYMLIVWSFYQYMKSPKKDD